MVEQEEKRGCAGLLDCISEAERRTGKKIQKSLKIIPVQKVKIYCPQKLDFQYQKFQWLKNYLLLEKLSVYSKFGRNDLLIIFNKFQKKFIRLPPLNGWSVFKGQKVGPLKIVPHIYIYI